MLHILQWIDDRGQRLMFRLKKINSNNMQFTLLFIINVTYVDRDGVPLRAASRY